MKKILFALTVFCSVFIGFISLIPKTSADSIDNVIYTPEVGYTNYLTIDIEDSHYSQLILLFNGNIPLTFTFEDLDSTVYQERLVITGDFYFLGTLSQSDDIIAKFKNGINLIDYFIKTDSLAFGLNRLFGDSINYDYTNFNIFNFQFVNNSTVGDDKYGSNCENLQGFLDGNMYRPIDFEFVWKAPRITIDSDWIIVGDETDYCMCGHSNDVLTLIVPVGVTHSTLNTSRFYLQDYSCYTEFENLTNFVFPEMNKDGMKFVGWQAVGTDIIVTNEDDLKTTILVSNLHTSWVPVFEYYTINVYSLNEDLLYSYQSEYINPIPPAVVVNPTDELKGFYYDLYTTEPVDFTKKITKDLNIYMVTGAYRDIYYHIIIDGVLQDVIINKRYDDKNESYCSDNTEVKDVISRVLTTQGKQFENMYIDPDCVTKFTGYGQAFEKDTHLYVNMYTIPKVNLSLFTSDGVLISSMEVDSNSNIASILEEKKEAYNSTFDNQEIVIWCSDGACTKIFDTSTNITSDTIIYGKIMYITEDDSSPQTPGVDNDNSTSDNNISDYLDKDYTIPGIVIFIVAIIVIYILFFRKKR